MRRVLFFFIVSILGFVGFMEHETLSWIEQKCRFPTTAGKSLHGKPCGKYLLPFQREIITELFNPDTTVNKAGCFLYGCRKVSKSLLYSWIFYYLISDPERVGFQAPLVASSYSQTEIIFRFIKEQVLMDTQYKKDFLIRKDFIENKKTGSLIHKVYNSPESNYGGQPSGMIADEINNYADDRNMESIETGMALSEDKPIKLYAANPPEDKEHFVIPLLKECEKDPDFFVKKFSADPKLDPFDPQTWARANPFIAEYFKSKNKRFSNVFSYYKKQAALAKASKQKEISYRRLLLGQGVSASHTEWFDTSLIKAAGESVYNRDDLRWAVGIDLSAVKDFTALSFIGYSDNEELFTKTFLYLPNLKKRKETQKKQFLLWEKQGFIKIQRKDVTDKEQIISDFKNFIHKYNIKPEAVIFDPALASHYYEDFKKYNPQTVYYSGRQMTASIREVERIGTAGKLYVIGKNPAILWQFKNCIVSQKSKGFCLLNRLSDHYSIDAAVAITLGMKYILDNPKKTYGAFYV